MCFHDLGFLFRWHSAYDSNRFEQKGVILEFVCNNYFPINGKLKHVLLPEFHSVECEHKNN